MCSEYKILNKELYEKCKDFITGALRLLKDKLKLGKPLPFIPQERIVIEELSDSGVRWSKSSDNTLSFIIFIDIHEKEIMQLPDYKACEKILHLDPVVRVQLNALFGTVDERGRIETKNILFSILQDIVLKNKNFDFNVEEFDRSYFTVEESLYSNKLKFHLIAPLENFRSDTDEVDLGEGIRIIRLSKSQLERIWRITLSSGGLSYDNIFDVRFALDKVYEKDKVEPSIEFTPQSEIKSPRAAVKKNFDSIVSALRIFRAGGVGCVFYQDIPLSWIPYGGENTLGGHSKLFGTRYNLNGVSIEDFVNFWSIFKEARTKKSWFLDEAIRRFNFSYEKENLEDKLIDYMICFESLLLEHYDELSYRLSLRVAVLLEEKRENRKEIFFDIERCLRS